MSIDNPALPLIGLLAFLLLAVCLMWWRDRRELAEGYQEMIDHAVTLTEDFQKLQRHIDALESRMRRVQTYLGTTAAANVRQAGSDTHCTSCQPR